MGSRKFMNQKIKCILSLWVILAWERISPEVILKGYKTCRISNAVDEMVCCGRTEKMMGMLGVSVRKMKALTVKMKTDTIW